MTLNYNSKSMPTHEYESPSHITTSKPLIRFSFLNVPKNPGEGVKKLTAVFCGKKKMPFSAFFL
jgi:hypothetical protein